MTQRAIWLFDSVCVLCEGGVRFTLRHEKEPSIRFVSIQSDEGRELAVAHGIDPDDPETFLFIDDGVPLTKSDGVIALAGHLSGPVQLIFWCRIFPKGLRDLIYEFVARNRYRIFGRKDACIVPGADTRHRFVL